MINKILKLLSNIIIENNKEKYLFLIDTSYRNIENQIQQYNSIKNTSSILVALSWIMLGLLNIWEYYILICDKKIDFFYINIILFFLLILLVLWLTHFSLKYLPKNDSIEKVWNNHWKYKFYKNFSIKLNNIYNENLIKLKTRFFIYTIIKIIIFFQWIYLLKTFIS